MSKNYNEKTRVQMPAMVHLTRLGYEYIGKKYEENAGETFDSETNILIDKFHSAFERLNPSNRFLLSSLVITISSTSGRSL